jgi:hypothetical protein
LDRNAELYRVKVAIDDMVEMEDDETERFVATLSQDWSNPSVRWKITALSNFSNFYPHYLPSPITKVRFTLVRGNDLPICDIKTSDPYVRLQWELQKKAFWKSGIVDKNLNPEWEKQAISRNKKEECEKVLDLEHPEQLGKLLIRVYDKDKAIIKKDDFMGLIELAPNELYPSIGEISFDLKDEEPDKKFAKGKIVFRISQIGSND